MSADKGIASFEHDILNRVQGLRSIVVSDRDGVVILRIPSDDNSEPTSATSSVACEAAFSIAADQASKIYLGRCKAITSMYDGQVLVQINDWPLVISLVADADSNVGALIALAPQLQEGLAPLREAVSRKSF